MSLTLSPVDTFNDDVTTYGVWLDGSPAARDADALIAGHFVLLTPCCSASGKGSASVSSSVVCRSCYREVASEFGGVYRLDDLDDLAASLKFRATWPELPQPTVVHVPALEDKGYCISQIHNQSFRIDGRSYSAGFAKNARHEHGGPKVPGWHGWLNMDAVVISAHPIAETSVPAQMLDLVVGPEGTLWQIQGNPRALSSKHVDALTLVRV